MTALGAIALIMLLTCLAYEVHNLDAPPWMLAAACLTVCALSALLLTGPTVTAHP